MFDLTRLDLIALAWFLAAWLGFAWLTDSSPFDRSSLTRAMEAHRRGWMMEMLKRDNRIVDTHIMSSLQNGTAFFASTALLALGASFTLLNQADRLVQVFGDLPLALSTTRTEVEVKVLILCGIYGYAFFKFGWAYRLFNYAAILIGTVPMPGTTDAATAEAAAGRAAEMQIIAGSHFNRGLRALFFSLGYLGWFVNGWIFMATTALIVATLVRRQYFSRARKAVLG